MSVRTAATSRASKTVPTAKAEATLRCLTGAMLTLAFLEVDAVRSALEETVSSFPGEPEGTRRENDGRRLRPDAHAVEFPLESRTESAESAKCLVSRTTEIKFDTARLRAGRPKPLP